MNNLNFHLLEVVSREFYYDFMDVYVSRADFEYCEMDTDSAYMALSADFLENIIIPRMKDQFDTGLIGFCKSENIRADNSLHWFPRSCCEKHSKFDTRTPGLFKLEFKGIEIIGLCSKTYVVASENEVKIS